MTDRLDQLNAGIEKMFPFCHAVLYAIVGTFFRASAMVTNDGPKPCSFGAPDLNNQPWQFMRQNWLSNRAFKYLDDIVDHCC
jgi:hypothetical protein